MRRRTCTRRRDPIHLGCRNGSATKVGYRSNGPCWTALIAYHRRAMTPDINPYAPPAEVPRGDTPPEGDPLHQFTLAQPSRGGWKLAIHPEAIHLVHDGDRPARRLDRPSFAAQAGIGFFGKKVVLTLRTPKPAVTIWLSPEALTALRVWMDPVLHQHLSRELARQRWAAIVFGLLWAFGSAPAEGRPADVPGIAFGAAWLAWAVAATWVPRRALFVLLAALWLGVVLSIVLRLAQDASWWNLIFVALVWPAAASSVRSFQFYRPIERATG